MVAEPKARPETSVVSEEERSLTSDPVATSPEPDQVAEAESGLSGSEQSAALRAEYGLEEPEPKSKGLVSTFIAWLEDLNRPPEIAGAGSAEPVEPQAALQKLDTSEPERNSDAEGKGAAIETTETAPTEIAQPKPPTADSESTIYDLLASVAALFEFGAESPEIPEQNNKDNQETTFQTAHETTERSRPEQGKAVADYDSPSKNSDTTKQGIEPAAKEGDQAERAVAGSGPQFADSQTPLPERRLEEADQETESRTELQPTADAKAESSPAVALAAAPSEYPGPGTRDTVTPSLLSGNPPDKDKDRLIGEAKGGRLGEVKDRSLQPLFSIARVEKAHADLELIRGTYASLLSQSGGNLTRLALENEASQAELLKAIIAMKGRCAADRGYSAIATGLVQVANPCSMPKKVTADTESIHTRFDVLLRASGGTLRAK